MSVESLEVRKGVAVPRLDGTIEGGREKVVRANAERESLKSGRDWREREGEGGTDSDGITVALERFFELEGFRFPELDIFVAATRSEEFSVGRDGKRKNLCQVRGEEKRRKRRSLVQLTDSEEEEEQRT